MALLSKIQKYSKNGEFDKILEMVDDPSMTKEDTGELFAIMATLSNPIIGKLILQLPEMPKGFPEKAEKACLSIIDKPNFDINGIVEINGTKNYPIQVAATLGNLSLLNVLIKKDANVNITTDEYPLLFRLLSFASKKSLPNAYKELFGSDPKDPDKVAENYKSIIKVLIENGANTNVVDSISEMTFIQMAQDLGLTDIVELARKKQGSAQLKK